MLAWLSSHIMTKKLQMENVAEEGQGLVEYGLILALIAVVAITMLTNIGSGILAKLTEVKNAIAGTT